MVTISKTFEWDMGHRVPNHKSICKNPHGHRYKMIAEVSGPLNSKTGSSTEGMVVDFGFFKELIFNYIVADLDHAFMYWEKDSIMKDFAKKNTDLKLLSVPFVPTAESIATFLAEKIIKLLSKQSVSIKLVSLRIFETPNSQAKWGA